MWRIQDTGYAEDTGHILGGYMIQVIHVEDSGYRIHDIYVEYTGYRIHVIYVADTGFRLNMWRICVCKEYSKHDTGYGTQDRIQDTEYRLCM